jgi:hypothetical protein
MTSPKESIMSYFPGMQKGNLDTVKSDAHGKIKKETVALQGVSVTRVTFDVGAKWSNDLKEYAGTSSCQLRWGTRLRLLRCYPAGTSNSTNGRLTRQKSTLFQ